MPTSGPDGIHVNVRLEDQENQRQCLLVVMGATAEGEKELIAVRDGYRESESSWTELLSDLKSRGSRLNRSLPSRWSVGFWAAVRKVFSKIREQRCWFHKSGNVLNNLPKSAQARAQGSSPRNLDGRDTRECYKAFDRFGEMYKAKYPKAWECLSKDKEELLAFYDFPAEHWKPPSHDQSN